MAKSADAFRTISEVSDWLGTPAHVLRFWESKFTQVKPVKRAGGRRYYRPNDMMLLGGLKKLLHEDGLTIKDAQKYLRTHGIKQVAGLSQALTEKSAPMASDGDIKKSISRVTDAPKSTPAPVVDLFANADSSPAQSDLFTAEPVETTKETPAEVAPDALSPLAEPAAPAASSDTPAPLRESPETKEPVAAETLVAPNGVIDIAALTQALQKAENPDVSALKSVYARLQSLHERMSAAAQDNNGN